MSLKMSTELDQIEKRYNMKIELENSGSEIFDINSYQKLSKPVENVVASRNRKLQKLEQEFAEAKKEMNLEQAYYKEQEIISADQDPDSTKLLYIVNTFYEFLPTEKQARLFDYYKSAKQVIWKLNSSNHREISRALRKLTAHMFKEVEIDKYVLQFVIDMDLPLPNFENVGNRSHDTAEMTHDRDSYTKMTAMSLISKTMVPVWGDYCKAMGKIGIPSIKNDFHCQDIVSLAYSQSIFAESYERLFDYTKRFIDKALEDSPFGTGTSKDRVKNGENNQYIMSFLGLDEITFSLLIFGFVLVKRMVIFDVFSSILVGEDRIPNLMIYISSRIGTTVQHTLKQIADKVRISPRFEPTDNSSISMDDSNITALENVSNVTRVTMDIPIINRLGTEHSLERAIDEYNINRQDFNDAVAFYDRNPISPNILSNAIVSIVLSPMLGVSKNMGYLDSKLFHKACVFTQFVLAQKGARYDQMVVLLTSRDDGLGLANPMEPIKVEIRNSYKKVPLYNDVVANFPHTCEQMTYAESVVGGKKKRKKIGEKFTVKQQIDRIFDWVACNDHFVNLWPGFWKRLDSITRQPQGSLFHYTGSVMEDIYRFLLEWCPRTPHQ